MKHLLLCCLLAIAAASGQAQSPGNVALDTARVAAKKEVYTYQNYEKTTKVNYILSGNINPFERDGAEVYFLTKIPRLSGHSVTLRAIDCRIKRFDTAQYSMTLTVFQPNKDDTLWKEVPIDPRTIDKKHSSATLSFKDVVLRPADFYIGYRMTRRKGYTGDIEYVIFDAPGTETCHVMINKGQRMIDFEQHAYEFGNAFTVSYNKLQ